MAVLSRLVLCAALVLTGCGITPLRVQNVPHTTQWQGRLSVTVHGADPSVTTAAFELRGNARTGELALLSPVGTTMALLEWSPEGAHLHRGQAPERYASLDDLTEQLTGSALPVAALWQWLDGHNVQVPGWDSDLSGLAQGRLVARRAHPAPAVSLRIQLDTAP